MRTREVAKIYVFGAGLIGLIMILAYMSMDSIKNQPWRPGKKLPAVEYLSKNGLRRLESESDRYKLIVLFNENCSICVKQLEDLNDNDSVHTLIDIVFITTDINFLINRRAEIWENLNSRNQIRFGIIKRKTFLEKFGSLITPSYYLFDENGELLWMAIGKVAFSQINMILLRSTS